MALIGRIRKNYWLVLLVLALALLAFILTDVMSSSRMGGAHSMEIGEIDGKPIPYTEFQTAEAVYFGNQGDTYQTRDRVWNYLVEKTILEEESEETGIGVSTDELLELEFGPNYSPIIMTNWRNPQTGQLNTQQLTQYKTAIENNDPLDHRFRQFWAEQEKQIIKAKTQDKIQTLVQKSIYTPSWMAESTYATDNKSVDFAYVQIPYSEVDGSQISLADGDFESYYNAHKKDFYNKEETRTAEYIVFDVLPTAEDEKIWQAEVDKFADRLRTETKDSAFVLNNGGYYRDYYLNEDELNQISPSIANRVQGMAVGQVTDAFREGDIFQTIKLIDKISLPDSVQARHILLSAAAGDHNGIQRARVTADSITRILRSGAVSFDSLAVKHSADPGSRAQGGDLGYFTHGRMVPSFNAATFYYGKPGNYYTVESQFGIHIIEILDQKYSGSNDGYKIAILSKPIIPTEQTQNAVMDRATDIIGQYQYLDGLVEAVKNDPQISIDRLHNVNRNDHTFGELGSGNTSREIVRWLFDSSTNTGDLSANLYTFTDDVNYYNKNYVIVGLKSIEEPGQQSLENVKSTITPFVLNQKKGEMVKSAMAGQGLQNVASQYGTQVDTAVNVKLINSFIPNIGSEPKILQNAFALNDGAISDPIVGTTGIYVISPIRKNEVGSIANLPSIRQQDARNKRNKIPSTFIQSLKEMVDIDDNRFTFF